MSISVNIQNNLVKILCDHLLFCEFSDEDVLDQNVAVNLMEQTSYTLSLFTKSEIGEILKIFSEIKNNFSQEEVCFLESFLEGISAEIQ